VIVLDLIAVALIAILGRGIFVFFSTYRTCVWCEKRKRPGRRCWRCKGTRRTRRIGAYHVHKVKMSLIQAWDEREFWR
jgi:hypothetical protein